MTTNLRICIFTASLKIGWPLTVGFLAKKANLFGSLKKSFYRLEFDELKPDVSLEHSESKNHPSAGFKSKLKRFFHFRTFTYKNMASGKKELGC